MAERVLVTPRSMSRGPSLCLRMLEDAGYDLVIPSPGRQPTETELVNSVEGVVGYVAGVEPISERFLRAASDLKAISRNGVGIENIDVSAAEALGVRVLRAEGANARGVAELALLHILLLSRKSLPSIIGLKQHRWERVKGNELCGAKLGVFGMGSIGSLVAELAQSFGMIVSCYDPYPSSETTAMDGLSWVSAGELWAESDIVTLHCPPQENGKPIVDRDALSQAKSGLLLVNTARSALVDEEAVLEALESDRLGGYSIDAFAHEPPTDWRLVDHPNVIATPHLGGFTEESSRRAAEAAVRNLLQVLGEL